MAYTYHQGFFKPSNPEKYKGNYNEIVFRSGLEFSYMCYLDRHPDVIRWASEESFFIISYRDPTSKGKIRRYFPDFWVQKRNKDGTISTVIVEIKPASQTVCPPMGKNGKVAKNRVKAALTYAKNRAKWDAAEAYCKQKGCQFVILTERDIL